MRRIRLALAAGLLALAGWSAAPRAAHAGEYDLEIITPHNEDIQFEFERGFIKKEGRPLKIRWIKKGTGQIIQQLDAQERGNKGGSFDLDVFFGGGVPDHDLAADKGFLEKPNLPADVLAGIPREIAGVANFGRDGLWYGSALSAFGVLMNRRGLENQNIPEVKSWADLADRRLNSWVVIADPRKSSSVRVCYELILQQYGWEKGWPLLMEIAGNSRLVTDSSSAVPNQIATGDVLAGPCIDFYAYARVAQAGGDVLAYVNPAGGSAITPDPISLLRKPPHRDLAERFITFVLSPEGQRLWILPPGEPGGPESKALHRMPVRADVCKQYADKLLIKDPYKEAEAGTFRKVNDQLQRDRNLLLAELMGAALVDMHGDLRTAWRAILDCRDEKKREAAMAEWNKLPFSEAESLELAKKLEAGGREARALTRGWSDFFRAKYEKVQQLVR